jgi:SnoaL-like domain
LKIATLASFKSKEAAMSAGKQATWEKYVSAWKEVTAKGKADALRQSVAATCVYTDPATIANGHEELIAYMLAFHQQVPGGHFVTTYFLAHHDVSIAKWNMVSGDGAVIGDGVSYGKYNEQGMLVTMTGFFETPPQ